MQTKYSLQSDGSLSQVVYLDFDGEDTSYTNSDLGLDFAVTVSNSEISKESQMVILAALTEKYKDTGITFTLDKPADTQEYSTIFIGDSDDFDEYGSFAGLAETIDKGNKIKNDNAFVFADNKTPLEKVISVINHEVGHIALGEEHSVTVDGLEDFAANYYLYGPTENLGTISCPATISGRISGVTYDLYHYTASVSFYVEKSGYYTVKLNTTHISGETTKVSGRVSGPPDIWYTGMYNGKSESFYFTAGSLYSLEVSMPVFAATNGAIIYDYTFTISFGGGTSEKYDLVYYTPTNWDAPIVVSKYKNTNRDTAISTDDTVFVDVAVLNDSDFTISKQFEGALYLDGKLVRTINCSDLQGGWYTYVEDYSIGKLSAGTHTLKLVIDHTGVISETNENNNTYTKTFTVTKAPKADLCIQNYEVSKTSIDASGSVKLSFRYANKGNKTAGSSVLKVYDGNTLLRTYSMGTVAAGSYREASVTIKGSELGNGARKLFLVADANNNIAESNEDNNKAYRTVTAGKADLCIQNYEVSSTSIGRGNQVKLYFNYTNKGNATASSSILKVYDGNTLLRSYSMGSVAAGSYRYGTVTLNGYELGNGARKLFLVADANNNIAESNEDNNKAYRTVTAGKADLCIQNYQISRSYIDDSDTVKLSFNYTNKGTATASSSVLKVYDGNTLLRTYSMGSVAAGSYRYGTVTLNGYELANGARKLYLVVDANNNVSESNEGNNKAYRTVTKYDYWYYDMPEASCDSIVWDDVPESAMADTILPEENSTDLLCWGGNSTPGGLLSASAPSLFGEDEKKTTAANMMIA